MRLFADAADNVDFASVTQLAVGIINKLDSCQRGITNTETTVAQYERSLKTAKAGAAIEGVPPPRPTTQAPPLQTAGSGGGGLPERKPSINFSARDLAVLKQKRAGEDQAERISEDASTSGLSRTAASSYGTPAKPASGGSSRTQQGQQQQEERGDQLPPDWVEKLDKKSGRAYYVNE